MSYSYSVNQHLSAKKRASDQGNRQQNERSTISTTTPTPSSSSATSTPSFRTSSSPLMRNDLTSFSNAYSAASSNKPIAPPSTSTSRSHAPTPLLRPSLSTSVSASSIPIVSAPYLPPPNNPAGSTYSAPPSAFGVTTRAHQTYSRSPPPLATASPTPSSSNGTIVTSSPSTTSYQSHQYQPPAPQQATSSRTFPSAFGVSQRVAIKASSRPHPASSNSYASTSSTSTSTPTTATVESSSHRQQRTAGAIDEAAWRRHDQDSSAPSSFNGGHHNYTTSSSTSTPSQRTVPVNDHQRRQPSSTHLPTDTGNYSLDETETETTSSRSTSISTSTGETSLEAWLGAVSSATTPPIPSRAVFSNPIPSPHSSNTLAFLGPAVVTSTSSSQAPAFQSDASPALSDSTSVFTAQTHVSHSNYGNNDPPERNSFVSESGIHGGSQPFPSKPNSRSSSPTLERKSVREGGQSGSILDRPRPTRSVTPKNGTARSTGFDRSTASNYISNDSPRGSSYRFGSASGNDDADEREDEHHLSATERRHRRLASEMADNSKTTHPVAYGNDEISDEDGSSRDRQEGDEVDRYDWVAGLDSPIAPINANFLPNRSIDSTASNRLRSTSNASSTLSNRIIRGHHKSSSSTSSIASFASASRKFARKNFGGSPGGKKNLDRTSTIDSPNRRTSVEYRFSSESERGIASGHGYSSSIDRPNFSTKGAAPTLSLDLDLGGSETMFDIASLLKASGGASPTKLGYNPTKKSGSDDEEEEEPPTPRAVIDSEPPTPRAASSNQNLASITSPSTKPSTVQISSWVRTDSLASPASDSSPATRSQVAAVNQGTPSIATATSNEVSPRSGTSSSPSTNSQTPSIGSRTTPITQRKVPPKVDLKLQMELEMERALATPSTQHTQNAAEVVPTPGNRMTALGYEVPIDPSSAISSSSYPSVTEAFQDPSTSPTKPFATLPNHYQEPVKFDSAPAAISPPKTKRRRSFGSLLTRSPSKDALNALNQSQAQSPPSHSQQNRATTPDPSLSMSHSTSFSHLSSQPSSSSLASLNATTPTQATNFSQLSGRVAREREASFDKSLPPTPADQSPLTEMPHRFENGEEFGYTPTAISVSNSMAKTGASVIPGTSGTFGKSFAKLRNAGGGPTNPSGGSSSSSVFQVISATTTKKPSSTNSTSPLTGLNESYAQSNRNAPISSQQIQQQPRSTSIDSQFSPTVLPPSVSAPSTSIPLGKRLVGNMMGNGNKSSQSKKPSEFDSSTLPFDESSLMNRNAAASGVIRPLIRRKSISGLLNGAASSSSAGGGGGGEKKSGLTMLGMSLPSARKSEELLGRFGGVGGKKKSAHNNSQPSMMVIGDPILTASTRLSEDDSSISATRRSFDALTKHMEPAPKTMAYGGAPGTDDVSTQASLRRPIPHSASQISIASIQSTASNLSSISNPSSDRPQYEKAQLLTSSYPLAPTRIPPPSIDSIRTTPTATTPTLIAPTASSAWSDASSSQYSLSRRTPTPNFHDEEVQQKNNDTVPPSPTTRGGSVGRQSPAPPIAAVGSLPNGLSLGTPMTRANRSTSPSPAESKPLSGRNRLPMVNPNVATMRTVWPKRAKLPDVNGGIETTMMSRAWMELEDALRGYRVALRENRPDRGPLIAGTLLAFLKREEDSPSPRVIASLADRQRQILFDWIDVLTDELRDMQPTHRGVCLEAVATILECRFLSAIELQDHQIARMQYRSSIVKVLVFAIDKLNEKAVYANTLVFSGRILALTFFRIEGVALKLLRALPPIKKAYLKRILEEVGVSEAALPSIDLDIFPSHLWSLCLRSMRTYTDLLLPVVPKPVTEEDGFLVRDGQISIEMTGNWLIRWTASDSDLPFAFYRAYHRQLVAHFVPFESRREFISQGPVDPTAVITAPGCLFLAASILEKTDALVHRNLRSVTSIGPNNSNFNTNDSANLSFGQKPKILELANRRVVATMLDIVGGPPSPAPPPSLALSVSEINLSAASDAETRRRVFGRMLRLWIRACVKKTSMWDTRSVFILLDLLEGMIYTLSYPPPTTAKTEEEEIIVPRPTDSCLEMFDIPFIFSFVKIILSEADNTVTLMRTIAFLYAHFEIFTLRNADRQELCENIILDKDLFPRLYLHWNAGVRGYFIRLLVWRLARLGVVDAEQNPNRPRDPAILALFGLMNVRLEAIRKRHDELEPIDNLTDDDLFKPKRSTICSTRGVKEAPFAVDELVASLAEHSDEDATDDEEDDHQSEIEQETMRTTPVLPSQPFGTAPSSNSEHSSIESGATGPAGKKRVARVVSWLKGGLGKKQSASFSSSNKSSISSMEEIGQPNSRVNPFVLDTVSSSGGDDPSTTNDSASLVTMSSNATSSSSHSLSDYHEASPDLASTTTEADENPMPPRASSPQFFAFEFEGAAIAPPKSETPETSAIIEGGPASSSSAASLSDLSISSGDTVFPQPGSLRRQALDPNHPGASLVSPRVSLRFSKRISILPPAALDLFKESGAPVPLIPERFRPQVYDRKLHQYAVRSLREYEDALDEWTDWVARLQEEEDEGKKFNKGFVDAVPRLAVSWPSSFESEE